MEIELLNHREWYVHLTWRNSTETVQSQRSKSTQNLLFPCVYCFLLFCFFVISWSPNTTWQHCVKNEMCFIHKDVGMHGHTSPTDTAPGKLKGGPHSWRPFVSNLFNVSVAKHVAWAIIYDIVTLWHSLTVLNIDGTYLLQHVCVAPWNLKHHMIEAAHDDFVKLLPPSSLPLPQQRPLHVLFRLWRHTSTWANGNYASLGKGPVPTVLLVAGSHCYSITQPWIDFRWIPANLSWLHERMLQYFFLRRQVGMSVAAEQSLIRFWSENPAFFYSKSLQATTCSKL